MERVDVTIVGAGVVGLAVARALCDGKRSVVILEKNERYGLETSSRNSEVIHSGIYYVPKSLKAVLCAEGKNLIYEYCARKSIPFRKLGKIVTVNDRNELSKLEALYRRGLENGLSDLELLDSSGVKKLEPNIRSFAGILSLSTGIFSVDLFMDSLWEEAKSGQAMLLTKTKLTGAEKKDGGYEIRTDTQEPFFSRIVVNSAGLFADQVAGMIGIDPDEAGYRIRLVKGEYFRLKKAPPITRLIYPLPTALSLGIHLTPDLAGNLRLGPSAFPVDRINYDVSEEDRPAFLEAARNYFPEAKNDDLEPGASGIRPHLAKFEGERPDFIIRHETDRNLDGWVNLIGIESPGLTASLAIARSVKQIIKDLLIL